MEYNPFFKPKLEPKLFVLNRLPEVVVVEKVEDDAVAAHAARGRGRDGRRVVGLLCKKKFSKKNSVLRKIKSHFLCSFVFLSDTKSESFPQIVFKQLSHACVEHQ